MACSEDGANLRDAGAHDAGARDSGVRDVRDAGVRDSGRPNSDAGHDAALQPECFSPTQRPDLAYRSGNVGCGCKQVGLRICVGSYSLRCSSVAGALVWSADEFGACTRSPISVGCSPRERYTNPNACLARYSECHQLPSGEFCGGRVHCRGTIDCSREPCWYQAFDPADCSRPLRKEVREGRCGNVRFRTLLTEYSLSVYYWDSASGELLASIQGTDVTAYCNDTATFTTNGDFTIEEACPSPWDDEAAELLCELDDDGGGR